MKFILDHIKPIGQFYYGIFSIFLITLQAILIIPFALLIAWFTPESIFPLLFLIITIISIGLQIYLSLKRTLDAGINPYVSFLHIIPIVSQITVLILILHSPKVKQEASLKEGSISEYYMSTKYYIWFFAFYFILESFSLLFRIKTFNLQLQNPSLVPLFNALPILFSSISILLSLLGIYFILKQRRNITSGKIVLIIIICVFILYSQINTMRDRVFSEKAYLYRSTVAEYKKPKIVLEVTRQSSLILNNNQEVSFMPWGDTFQAIQKLESSKGELIGKEVIIKLPTYDEWKPNYYCRERCSFPAFIFKNSMYLNVDLGFITYKK